MNKIFLFLFVIVGLVQLYASYYHGEYVMIETFSKLSLMPILIFWTLYHFIKSRSYLLVWLIGALIFALVGDFYLINAETRETDFLLGLGAFFITHILYAVIFIKLKKASKDGLEIQLMYKAPVYLITLVMTSAFVFIHLKPQMLDLVMPVVAYMIAIVIMVSMAMNLSKKVNQRAFLLIIVGALSFMLSDAAIAFNKFDSLIANSQFYIMFLYMLAQIFIARGIILESEIKSIQ